ncbi:MAG TPA: TolC family protein, partial [Desulfatirhabdiaceae bacterium]|nr:TolC family protein [Desulfatirhabdiaceae bacterium]
RLQSQLKQIELQIYREVALAYQQIQESAETIKTAETALRQAKENMELADGRYQNGVGNAIEYADAELVLTQAKINLIQANYEYLQYLAQLDYAVGRLNTDG